MKLRIKFSTVFMILAVLYGGNTVMGADKKETTLLKAAKEGNMALARKAIADKVDINARDEDGVTALLVALVRSDVAMFKFLIESGADVNKKSVSRDGKEGNPPIIYAVTADDIQFLKLLIHARADVNAPDWDGNTPLQYATLLGLKEQAKLLKQAGAK